MAHKYLRQNPDSRDVVERVNYLINAVLSYKSGSGSPSGVVTPEFIGQEYLDTTGNAWYKAYGLVNTNWQAL